VGGWPPAQRMEINGRRNTSEGRRGAKGSEWVGCVHAAWRRVYLAWWYSHHPGRVMSFAPCLSALGLGQRRTDAGGRPSRLWLCLLASWNIETNDNWWHRRGTEAYNPIIQGSIMPVEYLVECPYRTAGCVLFLRLYKLLHTVIMK